MNNFDPTAFVKNLQANNIREGGPATYQGRPMKLRSGGWGAWVDLTDDEPKFDDIIEITTRAGKKFNKSCQEIVAQTENGWIIRTI